MNCNDSATKDTSVETIPEGRVIDGKYRIIRLVGRGGMGQVYEAENITIGKHVALKFIDTTTANTTDGLERFIREARVTGSIESSHIVQVFDAGRDKHDKPYIVMELLRGETLGQRLSRVERLAPIQAVHIIMQALRGLHRAHQVDVIHRDLKPDNIFLESTDTDPLFVKILDFGISKFIGPRKLATNCTPTERGIVLGSPYYISPEQARSLDDIDERSDVWSMGAILYESITGRRPFTGDTYEQVVIAICTTHPTAVEQLNPEVPKVLCDIVMRALSPQREQRFGSAMQMLEALQQAVPQLMEASFQDMTAVSASNDTYASVNTFPISDLPSSLSRKGLRWRVFHIALVVTGLLVTIAASIWIMSVMNRHPEQRAATESSLHTKQASTANTRTLVEKLTGQTPVHARSDLSAVTDSGVVALQRVKVQTNVPDAIVEVDGIALSDGSFLALAGQSKTLVIRAAGFEPVEQVIQIKQAQSSIRIDLAKRSEKKNTSPPSPRSSRPSTSKSSTLTGGLKLKTELP